jgi:hypothetical protein
MVGLSTHGGYSVNEKAAVSLGIVDIAHTEPGTELVIVWGEAGGGSRKPVVERHEQTTIRATVRPVPFAKTVRDMKYQVTGATN